MKNGSIIIETDNESEIDCEFFNYESINLFSPLFDKFIGFDDNIIILDHDLLEKEYDGFIDFYSE